MKSARPIALLIAGALIVAGLIAGKHGVTASYASTNLGTHTRAVGCGSVFQPSDSAASAADYLDSIVPPLDTYGGVLGPQYYAGTDGRAIRAACTDARNAARYPAFGLLGAGILGLFLALIALRPITRRT